MKSYITLPNGMLLDREAELVINRNKYRGMGRPRKTDYAYTMAKALAKERKMQRKNLAIDSRLMKRGKFFDSKTAEKIFQTLSAVFGVLFIFAVLG